VLWLPWDYAGLKQIGQVRRVGCITEKGRRPARCFDVKDFLHGSQIGRMRIVDRASVGKAVLVFMSQWRDDDLADRVIEVVRVVTGYPVGFAFVPPENDHAAVLVGFRGHDERNQAAQGIIALPYIGRIAGQTCKAAAESAVHVVVLIGRNPVVIGHAVLREIECQLLQRRVVFG